MLTNKYPYIIAELGCNHNGDIELAKEMIDEAKKCGCNAVKLQLWQKDELVTRKHLMELNEGTIKLENVKKWETKELGLKNIHEQIEKFTLSYDEHIELFKYAKDKGMGYSSTPITKEGIDFLVENKVDFIKISSMDINNLELIEYSLSKNYPLIISTGLASLGEIEKVVNLIPNKLKKNITLLHCISLYPPDDKIVNLKIIKTLNELFDINVGYSDHTLGFSIVLAAVALGAMVIEKHFTLDKNMPGWDHKISADPNEMRIICTESKRIINACGKGYKKLTDAELNKRLKFRRSIVSSKNIKRGSSIKENDIIFKRPGTGIGPDEIKYVIGRKVNRDISIDELIKWEDLI